MPIDCAEFFRFASRFHATDKTRDRCLILVFDRWSVCPQAHERTRDLHRVDGRKGPTCIAHESLIKHGTEIEPGISPIESWQLCGSRRTSEDSRTSFHSIVHRRVQIVLLPVLPFQFTRKSQFCEFLLRFGTDLLRSLGLTKRNGATIFAIYEANVMLTIFVEIGSKAGNDLAKKALVPSPNTVAF